MIYAGAAREGWEFMSLPFLKMKKKLISRFTAGGKGKKGCSHTKFFFTVPFTFPFRIPGSATGYNRVRIKMVYFNR